MKALIFSDSHGRVQPMLDAVDIYGPDVIFHLGDVVRDAEQVQAAYPKLPFYQVRGNCDGDLPGYQDEGIARLAGKTIFYLHGHTRTVERGLGLAVAHAQSLEVDLMLFGHTHAPLETRYDSLLVVNPGAIKDGLCALLFWDEGGPITRLPISL